MTDRTTELDLIDVSKAYAGAPALHPTSLSVGRGEFVTLLGPSGCGKSTLLRIITGITEPTGGTVRLREHDITALPPERRDIAIVFQSYALFPHMSVAENILFGLKMKRVAKPERQRRFDQVVAMCGLAPLVGRSPRQLSGGQQQRVALARALVMHPALLLLDEPLSNLDAKLRESLRDDLLSLHRQTGSTTLYVTHDQAEAMSMSDRIIVMNQGRVVETGTPRALYLTPKTRFTALFFGQTNILPVEAAGDRVRLPWGALVPLATPATGAGEVSLRPECVRLTPDTNGAAIVADASFMGADVYYTLRVGGLTLRARHGSHHAPFAPGSAVALAVDTPLSLLADAERAASLSAEEVA